MNQFQVTEQPQEGGYQSLPPATAAPARESGSAQLLRFGLFALFATIASIPVISRILRPTILGDDVIRLVDLIERPLSSLLLRPFSEHVAPGTELVSWLTWHAIGEDIRRAPIGLSTASVLPWVLLLTTFGIWLKRETGSRTATLISVALVAQSPLALEAMWWYSASTFTWAILGVFVALLGVSLSQTRPWVGLGLVAAGVGLGPSFCTLGLLAFPLTFLRTVIDPSLSRKRKFALSTAAVLGLGVYLVGCELGGMGISQRQGHAARIDLVSGLPYVIAVPGQMLWPSVMGVRPSWTANLGRNWKTLGLGLVALAATAVLVWKTPDRRKRAAILVGTAMIYLGYGLTYGSRTCLVQQGRWTEQQMLYEWGGRYHELPLLGMGAVLAIGLTAVSRVRVCDRHPTLPILLGIGTGILAFSMNRQETQYWNWMLNQPDQPRTFQALHSMGEAARDLGIGRDQLIRLFDPPFRNWNGSVLNDCPRAFHLTKLVPQTLTSVDHDLPDDLARSRLLARLKHSERVALQAGVCLSLNPPELAVNSESLSLGELVDICNLTELSPGHFRRKGWPAYLEYAIDTTNQPRYLEFNGLASDQNLEISWADATGKWTAGQHAYWLGTSKPSGAPAVIDLTRLINWPSSQVTKIRVTFPAARQVGYVIEPRLLR